MKLSPEPNKPEEEKTHEERVTYETPAVVYEGIISTRAGSPLGGIFGDGVDPTDLFGE